MFYNTTILLIAHSGRFCSAGRLLFECAQALRCRGADLEITFPREDPSETVASAYAEMGVKKVALGASNKYDLAIANCQASAVAIVTLRRTFNKRIVFWIHECWKHREPELMKAAVSMADAFIFQSAFQRDILYGELLARSTAPIFLVPNCASLTPGHKLERTEVTPVIVTVGSMIPRKRVGDLVDAVLACKGTPVTYLVGDDSKLETTIRDKILTRPKQFVLTGILENSDAQSIIAAGNVYVHPSAAESQSIAVLEAMQHGKAIILADLPTYKDMHLIHRENCLMYPAGDTAQLRNCIENVLGSKRVLVDLGKAAQITYRKYFSVPRFHENMVSAICKVLSI